MTESQFNDITKWQTETFGEATALSKMAHLQQEIQEYIEELKNPTKNKRLEFADCVILLFGAGASDGMTYEDCCQVINEKMTINKGRKWGTPDKNGVVNHIK